MILQLLRYRGVLRIDQSELVQYNTMYNHIVGQDGINYYCRIY